MDSPGGEKSMAVMATEDSGGSHSTSACDPSYP